MDFDTILSLCKKFEYECIPCGKFVFNKGDASNNKFYVIISGQVSIVIPPRKEDIIAAAAAAMQKQQTTSPQNRKTRKDAKTLTFATQLTAVPPPALKQLQTAAVSVLTKEKVVSAFTHQNTRAVNTDKTRHLSVPGREKIEEEEKTNGNPGIVLNEKGLCAVQKRESKIEEKCLEEQSEYEECPPECGTVVRKMNEGESFGELALKNNTPRSAGVFCNTECEFLIITKQQFDLIFLKKELEKEAFLKASFPYLGNNISSSIHLNYLLFSFKVTCYNILGITLL